ncbi:hypothetical protein TRIATDRAFT_296945 [Trichoderma atroviride IMI 206040]|uniref:Uncharacterized protein n=1 Tax=Hypocrea atroviridis (strain ATCC 20476 / IMI 206040) TaxID=452589 RepID=G9NF00_HYPAI|nr:uncharacterized protein TRIATDRAFT_296945 [Trichoderma atroviride IMI 206040]EHK50519.1 hypothetical protein TRIATDRAFT_296945 [Trichoderma atroviride IMI 206040]
MGSTEQEESSYFWQSDIFSSWSGPCLVNDAEMMMRPFIKAYLGKHMKPGASHNICRAPAGYIMHNAGTCQAGTAFYSLLFVVLCSLEVQERERVVSTAYR